MADDDSTTDEAPPATDEEQGAPPELGDAGKKALDRMKAERDAARKEAKANADAAKRLSQLEESQKTEQQRLSERAEAAERTVAEVQGELVRLRVITEVGLPADLHEFVVGSDEDILRAKANKLKAQFGADQRSVDVGLGPRVTPGAPDMNAALRRAAGRA